MLRNQDPQLHSTSGYPTTLQVGSPPPTLPCPHCLRHFRSKGGRTKHIKVKHRTHTNGPDPELSLPPSSSHSSSHTVQIEQPPSPIPSDAEYPQFDLDYIPPSPSSSHSLQSSHNVQFERPPSLIQSDAEFPQFDPDYIPPDLNIGNEVNEDNPMEQPGAPNPPHITYIYHPKLNGK
jgi:hypothetical protein